MSGAIVLLIPLVPFLAWLILHGRGYKRDLLDRPPGLGWGPTGEAFADPTTGEWVRVWTDAASGERAYVRVGASNPA